MIVESALAFFFLVLLRFFRRASFVSAPAAFFCREIIKMVPIFKKEAKNKKPRFCYFFLFALYFKKPESGAEIIWLLLF